MPANNDFPVLDGVAPSWADVIVRLATTGGDLLEMKDISAINSGRTLEVGVAKRGGRDHKRTTGALSQEASLTLYREGYQKLLRGLKAAAPVRGNQRILSLVHFHIQFQHTPPGSVEIFERRIKGCRVTTDALNSAEGTDADTVEVGLSVIEIADVIDGEEVVLL